MKTKDGTDLKFCNESNLKQLLIFLSLPTISIENKK